MTNCIFRKPLALFLAMMMVLGLFPMGAVAAEPDSITAYITISVKGKIAKKGDAFIAQVPVNVTDHNGNHAFDIDDALFALHEAYYTGGAASGYSSASGQYGLSITKLWGDTSGAYGYWVNNASANSLADTVSAGDHITAFVYADPTWSDSYAKFDVFTKQASVGEAISLKLQKAGYDAIGNMVWSNLSGASIYTVADDSNVVLATTNESGEATVSFPTAGTYYITASKASTTMVPPVCKITVAEASAPSKNDTTLSALPLTFPGNAVSDGVSYLGTSGMHVGTDVQSVTLSATAKDSKATTTATYKAADAPAASAYTLGESAALAVGDNTFNITVTNGADTQIHTLVITRKGAENRDIPSEVASVISSVKTVTGDAPYTDWILAMKAAGLSPTDAQLRSCLEAVLTTVNQFADKKVGNPATMAKIAIALTSLGIDARQIPDPDGGEAMNLVKAAAAYDVKTDSYPVYSAPYLLSLYDLGNYEVPTGAASTRLALLDAILAAEKDWTAWGFDAFGMVLPALTPYYKATAPVNGIELAKCQEITAAVDRALDKMSAAQTVDGGFGAPNSSTVSTVITGLNAIGINSNSDSRFCKSGTSLLQNLLSFRTAEDKLGFKDTLTANTLSGLQGFQALATWQNLSNARSRNLYHFTKEIAPYTNWPSARLLTGIAITKLPTNLSYQHGTAGTAANTIGMVITATYNADAANTQAINIADCTVSTIDCTTAGTKTVTVSYQGKSATFLVNVLDANGNVPKQKTVSVAVRNGSTLIAGNSALTIEAGVTSALEVLKTVLNAAGKTYVIKNGSYVAEVNGLGEFGKGATSGWLYSVNGVTPPTTAANDYKLSDGDTVLWYYTQDYTTDSSSSKWKSPETKTTVLTPSLTASNGLATASISTTDLTAAIAAVQQGKSSEINIEPQITGTTKQVALTIPKVSLSEIASLTTADLRVQTPIGSVTIPNSALSAITAQTEGSAVTLTLASVDKASLTAAQKETVGGNPVYDISILSGSKHLSSFGNHTLTISLPYTLKSGEDASGVTVWYLDNAAKLQQMTASYDGKTGLATFTTPHLSYYVVGYAAPFSNTFSDVQATDWFYPSVKYAVQNKLFYGTAESAFAPNEHMTRAMLVTVLYRLEGNPAVTAAGSFSDVPSGQWYADAVTWARANQIVSGYGSGLFGANDKITREQMATILYRYAQYKGGDMTKTSSLNEYTDAKTISTWASDAMKWAKAKGLITGTSATTLSPAENATRAQVATLLMRLGENGGKS